MYFQICKKKKEEKKSLSIANVTFSILYFML